MKSTELIQDLKAELLLHPDTNIKKLRIPNDRLQVLINTELTEIEPQEVKAMQLYLGLYVYEFIDKYEIPEAFMSNPAIEVFIIKTPPPPDRIKEAPPLPIRKTRKRNKK